MHPTSDAAVPLVAAVFPEAAIAIAELGEAVDRLDFHDVFRLLIAELAFDAGPDWGAVGDRERLVVQLVSEDRLWVERVLETVALVVAPSAVERFLELVGADEDE